MATLRQRKVLAKLDADADAHGDDRARRELHGRQPTLRSARSLGGGALAAVALVVVAATVLMRARGDARLPPYYAVCSTEGRVYTASATSPAVECVVVEDGRVSAVGTLQSIRLQYGDEDTLGVEPAKRRRGRGLKVFRIKKGWSVVPGLMDGHAHLMEYGEAKNSVDLVNATSVKEIISRTVKHIQSRPDLLKDPEKFVKGSGWDQTLFASKSFPTAEELSNHPLIADRRLVFTRIDYHAVWVSNRVLDLLGPLDKEILGGQIIKDSQGRPTGIFLDKAIDLILEVSPKRSDEERLRNLRIAARDMLSNGMIGVQDAACTPAELDFFEKLDRQGKLPIRIYGMVNCEDQVCSSQVRRYTGDRFRVGHVKLFLDGALGSWGASLWSPYSDDSTTSGINRLDSNQLESLIKAWTQLNFSIATHAIGDRANSMILDAYESFFNSHLSQQMSNDERREKRQKLVEEWKFRVEHAQVVRKADVERFNSVGIIASLQPTHATSDMWFVESRLGRERIKTSYLTKSFLNLSTANNTIPAIIFGSDFPVSPLPIKFGFHSAMFRTDPFNFKNPNDDPSGWFPKERVSGMETLLAFTKNVAMSTRPDWSNDIGSLSIGRRADWVLLDGDWVNEPSSPTTTLTNLKTAGQDSIVKVNVRATVMDGQLVFGRI